MRVLSLFMALSLAASTNILSQQKPAPFEEIREGLLQGSPAAVFEARRQRNPAFVPLLKDLLKSPDFQLRHFENPEVEITLAILEDEETLQALVCTVQTGHPIAEELVLDSILPAVGGLFAVRTYQQVLTESHNVSWKKRLRKYRSHFAPDAGFDPPQVTAVFRLSQMVPGEPRRYAVRPSREIREELKFWIDWLQKNLGGIPANSPIGSAIDYSGSVCHRKQYVRRVQILTSFALGPH